MNPLADTGKAILEVFSLEKPTWGSIFRVFLVFLFLIVLGLIIAIPFLLPKNTPVNDIDSVVLTRQTEIESGPSNQGLVGQQSLYSSLLQSLDERERHLVNLQPLTGNVGGYIGPLSGGVFSVDFYLQKALRAGIRSFILPISTYLDDNKVEPYWPYSGKPAIVFRENNGIIRSLNGLTVKKFCESLMTYRNENSSQADEPIFITLTQVDGHVPDPVKQEKEYVMLMRDIAKELKPLDSSRLITYGQLGPVVGGQREKEILTQIPLQDLKNKIILATTFDTRLGLKDKYVNMRPSLHEYSNFILQPMVNDPGQATMQPNILQGANTGNSSKILRLNDVVGSKVNYVEMTRSVWHSTVLDDPSIVPKQEDIVAGLKAGIQCIPLPFFYTDSEELQTIWNEWGGYAWRLKEKDSRFVKPAPIVPAKPSEAMNARVSPTLQPGQTSIQ